MTASKRCVANSPARGHFWFAVRAVLAGAVMWTLPVASNSAADQASVDAAVATLDAAVGKWRQQVEFKCRYTYKQGIAASREDALAGKFKRTAEGKPDCDVATGVFDRLGPNVRFSIDFGRPPADASLRGDATALTNVSFDSVVSNELLLKYLPLHGKFGGTLRVARRPLAERSLLRSDATSDNYLNPLFVGGGVSGSPLASFRPRPGYGETVSRSVAKLDSTKLQVTMIRRGRGGTQKKAVVFRTDLDPPVIEEISDIIDSPGKGPRAEDTVYLSAFVKCGDVWLASVVREAGGPLRTQNGEIVWVGKEWSSADLGKRSPTPDDFSIHVPEGVRVRGIKRSPSPIKGREINVLKLGLADLDNSPFAKDSIPVTEAVPERRAVSTSIVAIGAAIVVAALILAWLMSRR